MKLLPILLSLLIILPQVWGDEPDYIQQFNKITDPAVRAKLIDKAPPDEKEKLQKLDLIHRYLLQRWGGEEKLKRLRETQVARIRGLGPLEDVFHAELNFWEGYIGAVLEADRKAGAPIDKQQEDEIDLKRKEDFVRKRVDAVHTLVFNLAPSPAALELAKRAKLLANQLASRQTRNSSTTHQMPITEQERMDADKQLDEIYTELQDLPKLTPDQAQKELDVFTDDKVQPW